MKRKQNNFLNSAIEYEPLQACQYVPLKKISVKQLVILCKFTQN